MSRPSRSRTSTLRWTRTDSVALAVWRGNRRDGGAAPAGHALHPGGVHPVVLHAGGGAGPVRAAVAGGRLRHDRQLPPFQHVRAGPVGLALEGRHGRRDEAPSSASGASPRCSVRPRVDPPRVALDRWFRVYLHRGGRPPWSSRAGTLGTEIFPQVDAGQFQFRLKAPTGTRIEQTEEITQEALRVHQARRSGRGRTSRSRSATSAWFRPSYPINTVYLWIGGPEEVGDAGGAQAGHGARSRT